MKQYWNIWRGGGVTGQIPSAGGMDIFLNHPIQLHFVSLIGQNKFMLMNVSKLRKNLTNLGQDFDFSSVHYISEQLHQH